MFESLIADPRVLFQGLLEDPERYESGASELLQNLASGRKKREDLSPEEQSLLDRTTVEFASGRRPRPAGGAARSRPTQRQLTPPEEVELIHSDRGPHIPVAVAEAPAKPPSFWWRK